MEAHCRSLDRSDCLTLSPIRPASYLAFRESFLRFQRNKNPLFGLKDSQTMDIDQLWSSTIAGASTGGILSALARMSFHIRSLQIMKRTIYDDRRADGSDKTLLYSS